MAAVLNDEAAYATGEVVSAAVVEEHAPHVTRETTRDERQFTSSSLL